uniref:Putative BURP domain-containing protein 17-like n=1 Tax=Davidia involucrata TaxID=16924 RepID=A0A5B6ZYA8_DAVIN
MIACLGSKRKKKLKEVSRTEDMGSICCLLFYVLLVLKSAPSSRAREIARGHWNDVNYKEVLYDVQHHVMDDDQKGMHEKHVDDEKIARKHVHLHDDPSSHMDHMDQALNVFFTVNDLKVGKKMAIYFPIKDSPHLLPKEEADSIPFSLPQLPHLLEFFSFSQDSPQPRPWKIQSDTVKLNQSKERPSSAPPPWNPCLIPRVASSDWTPNSKF